MMTASSYQNAYSLQLNTQAVTDDWFIGIYNQHPVFAQNRYTVSALVISMNIVHRGY